MNGAVRFDRRAALLACIAAGVLLVGCVTANVEAPVPVFETGADTSQWAAVPAGPFFEGEFDHTGSMDHGYGIMVYLVTQQQYAEYLNAALPAGNVRIDGNALVGYYPGDTFRGARHEERIDPGDYVYLPLADPAVRIGFDGKTFSVKPGWEMHPMTMVSWFGAKAYCDAHGWRLPTEAEWEKAARGPLDGADGNRPFPWGDEITHANANYYSSRDPFEAMASYGSRTTPVGFYNGKTYGGFATLDSPSPYGLYDMAGNVWQWTGDVYPYEHYRYLRGGSKDTYDMDLRVWVRNSATPTYTSPGVGFRCAR
jgi:formylglycine-generating enzyme required for sulfatase activity